MEMDFGGTTHCYFGPGYVSWSRLFFLFALAVLLPWLWLTLRRPPEAIRARLGFIRALLLTIVAPGIAVMAMALHFWVTVEYPSRLTLVRGSSDPLLSVFRHQLLWFIARPSISLALLASLLLLLRVRVGLPKHEEQGTA